MSERVGDTRDEYIELFDVYWPIAVAVYLIVFVAVAVVVFRYRTGSDAPSKEPVEGERKDLPLEGAYAFFVACIVATLLYFTFDTMSDVDTPGPDGQASAEVAQADPDSPAIDVTAARWSWRFDYDEGVSVQGEDKQPPTLVVPSETPIRFRLTSRDVIHSFWIPHVRFKRDAFPERTTSFVLRFHDEDEGFHRGWGECAEFCGLLHSEMGFNVHVLPLEEFETWLDEQRSAV